MMQSVTPPAMMLDGAQFNLRNIVSAGGAPQMPSQQDHLNNPYSWNFG